MIMEYSCIQLNDLPDEILIMLFKKLANAEVLYSLSGVNKRLNKIVHDSIFANDLSLVMSRWDGLIYSLSDLILDRFCSHILPKINQKIQWLHLESLSMERILRATNYPNLYEISLHNIQLKTAIDLFTGKIFFIL
jgi:F-box associated protein